jgi:nucleoid-associated protein YgaU
MSGFNIEEHYRPVQVAGILERDPLQTDILDFRLVDATSRYVVKEDEIGHYDLISFRAYGIEELYWVIMLVNNVVNPLSDLYPGMVLTIPSLTDAWAIVYARRGRP